MTVAYITEALSGKRFALQSEMYLHAQISEILPEFTPEYSLKPFGIIDFFHEPNARYEMTIPSVSLLLDAFSSP